MFVGRRFGDDLFRPRLLGQQMVYMPCSKHRQLHDDLEEAVAALDRVAYLQTSNPNTARDENLHRLGGLVTEARYKLRMHVTNCRVCSQAENPKAG
jgi:hypothetical protein